MSRKTELLEAPNSVEVVRLQREFWHEFLTKNAPKMSPRFLSLYFVDPKKSLKVPAIFPVKVSLRK